MHSLPDFGLIETFRRTSEGDFLRLPRHLRRLERSAEHFGFSFDDQKLHSELGKLESLTGNLRIRLELKRNGSIDLTTAPFEPLAPGTVWRLAIAREQLDAGSPLIRHKTTERNSYDHARAEFDRQTADEVLLLNTAGEICEGTITNVFVRLPGSKILLTPATHCGLLPGILREELLENDRAREATLFPSDIQGKQQLFVGNSLRGLIPASLG